MEYNHTTITIYRSTIIVEVRIDYYDYKQRLRSYLRYFIFSYGNPFIRRLFENRLISDTDEMLITLGMEEATILRLKSIEGYIGVTNFYKQILDFRKKKE